MSRSIACQCSLLDLLENLHNNLTTYAMSDLVKSVTYLRLTMMPTYSVCMTLSPVFLNNFTLGSYVVKTGLQSK